MDQRGFDSWNSCWFNRPTLEHFYYIRQWDFGDGKIRLDHLYLYLCFQKCEITGNYDTLKITGYYWVGNLWYSRSYWTQSKAMDGVSCIQYLESHPSATPPPKYILCYVSRYCLVSVASLTSNCIWKVDFTNVTARETFILPLEALFLAGTSDPHRK